MRSPVVLGLGRAPIPVIKVEREGERGMRLAEAVVERERPVRGRPGFRKGLLGRQHAVLPIARKRIGIRKPGVRLRVGRIGLDRLVEICDRLAQALLGALVPEEPAFEIGLVSGGIDPLAALRDAPPRVGSMSRAPARRYCALPCAAARSCRGNSLRSSSPRCACRSAPRSIARRFERLRLNATRVPSTIASTPSSRAISGNGLRILL